MANFEKQSIVFQKHKQSYVQCTGEGCDRAQEVKRSKDAELKAAVRADPTTVFEGLCNKCISKKDGPAVRRDGHGNRLFPCVECGEPKRKELFSLDGFP